MLHSSHETCDIIKSVGFYIVQKCYECNDFMGYEDPNDVRYET